MVPLVKSKHSTPVCPIYCRERLATRQVRYIETVGEAFVKTGCPHLLGSVVSPFSPSLPRLGLSPPAQNEEGAWFRGWLRVCRGGQRAGCRSRKNGRSWGDQAQVGRLGNTPAASAGPSHASTSHISMIVMCQRPAPLFPQARGFGVEDCAEPIQKLDSRSGVKLRPPRVLHFESTRHEVEETKEDEGAPPLWVHFPAAGEATCSFPSTDALLPYTASEEDKDFLLSSDPCVHISLCYAGPAPAAARGTKPGLTQDRRGCWLDPALVRLRFQTRGAVSLKGSVRYCYHCGVLRLGCVALLERLAVPSRHTRRLISLGWQVQTPSSAEAARPCVLSADGCTMSPHSLPMGGGSAEEPPRMRGNGGDGAGTPPSPPVSADWANSQPSDSDNAGSTGSDGDGSWSGVAPAPTPAP